MSSMELKEKLLNYLLDSGKKIPDVCAEVGLSKTSLYKITKGQPVSRLTYDRVERFLGDKKGEINDTRD